MLAQLVPPNIQFDPNAFWGHFFTYAATATTVLFVQFFLYLSSRNKQNAISTKLDAQDMKAEERTQQIREVKDQVKDVALKAAVTASTVQAIAQKTGTGTSPAR